MKFIVERDKFADAVTAAMRAAAKADTIPILNNLLLKPNGSAIGIAGTCLDMQLETSIPADIFNKNGEGITVTGDALSRIINGMPKGAQVSIECGDEEHAQAIIASGRSRYKLLTLPATDFPNLLQVAEPCVFEMVGKVLAAALSAIRFAVNKDRSRIYLNGIHLHVSAANHPVLNANRDDQLFLVGTDGRNMAVASFPVPDGAAKAPGVIVPDAAVGELIRLATDAADESVRLSVSTTLFAVESKGKTFTTKLIDGTFPDYQRVVPYDYARRAVVDCDDLSAALSRLISVGEGNRMRALFDGATLRLRLHNNLVGSAEEEVEIEYGGDPIDIGLNAAALISILDSAQSDSCLLRMNDARAPVLVQPWRAGAVDTTRTFISMPVE